VHAAAYRQHTLYTLVSDASRPTRVRLTDHPSGGTHVVEVGAGRAALLLLDRTSGAVADRYPRL
jgi:hypothetical protein